MAKTPKAATAEGGDTAKPARKARPAKGAGAAKAGGPARARPAKPAPTPVTGPVEGGTMKAKHLLERVAARSGTGRAAAKPVVDAVLVELGEALGRGEMLVLPGLGKVKVKAAKDGAKGGAIQMKLIPLGAKADKKDGETPLAPEED
jgi:hypothetical protein